MIDEIFTEFPEYGSRKIARQLRRDTGLPVNRKRIQSLMREMGICAIYAKPNTSRPAAGHKIYPYLLRGYKVTRPNQVWSTDHVYPLGAWIRFCIEARTPDEGHAAA